MMRSRLIEKNFNNVGEELPDSEDDEDNLQDCTVQQATCTANIKSCDFTKEEAQGNKENVYICKKYKKLNIE